MGLRRLFLGIIILFALFLYLPSLRGFFYADDWYHLSLVQINSFHDFINFFSFKPTAQSATFYRPLSTQVFFFILYSLVGLNAFWYYFFVLSVFCFSLLVLYKVAFELTKRSRIALISVLMYSASVTNFNRIYFLSAFQEILLVTTILLSLYFYIKPMKQLRIILSLSFFILALASKETAVIFPVILVVYELIKHRKIPKVIVLYYLILAPYVFFRFIHFGIATGDSYIWDFSPLKAANTFIWYCLWTIGAPEGLINFASKWLMVIPSFYSEYPKWSKIILTSLYASVSGLALLTIVNWRKVNSRNIFFIIIFIAFLFPVLFLPWHKFSLELGLPLVGFVLFIASLTSHKKLFAFGVTVYLVTNIISNAFMLMNFKFHYINGRSEISRRVFEYFSTKYPVFPEKAYFEFENEGRNLGPIMGYSRQIAFAVSNDNLFKVLYRDQNAKVYFEDDREDPPAGKMKIPLPSTLFLEK